MWPSGEQNRYLGIEYQIPHDYYSESNLPAYVVSDEFEAERSWRQLLVKRGLPYTPYKCKTYADRINNPMDYHESYVDGLFQKIRNPMWANANKIRYQPRPPPQFEGPYSEWRYGYDGVSNQPKNSEMCASGKRKGYRGIEYQVYGPYSEGQWEPYDTKSNQPAYVVSDEFKDERAWRELLQRRGLPYTNYKFKTYADRINNTIDYHESYVDGLFQKIPNYSSSSSASSSFVHPPPPPLKEKRPLRVLSESEDEDDALYEVMYGRKRRQLDDESLKLRKDKKYKSLNSIIYADEVSKKKQLNLIENEDKMRYLEFKRAVKGTFMDAFT